MEKYGGISIHYLDFDIYSKSIGLFYNDKERMGTIFGFTLTVIYLFASLSIFIYYTINTINKSDIKVHDSLLYQKQAPEINVNSSLFYFAFGVENFLTGYTRFIDETVYYPKAFYISKIKEGPNFIIDEEKPLNIERCQEVKFGKEYQNLLVNGELNNSYCLNEINLTLSGNFKYDKLSYIKLNIYPCVNTTYNNNHCKPREIIDSFLSGTFISILAKDIGLEPSNYTHPVVPQFQDIYVTIDKSFFRDFVVFYGITEIQTDQGLFHETLHKDRYINLMKTTQGIYYQKEENYNNGYPICEVQIRMADDIRIQKRTYRKMTDVFSITGGYMTLISTLFSIITFLTNKIDYEVRLVNNIFNFFPKKRKISLKHKLQKFTNEYSGIQNNSYISINKIQNSSQSIDKKGNSIIEINKSNLIPMNNIEISSPSFHIKRRLNLTNGKKGEKSIR